MSEAIHVYAVPLENLKQLLGSGAIKAAATICRLQADRLAAVDDIDDEAEMTCADAVTELITGRISNSESRHLYGYALEAICCSLGTELPNICPISAGSTYIEDGDRMLQQKRVPLQLTDLVFGGGPVDIPRPDDYPFIGWWPAEQIAQAAIALRTIDATGLDRHMAELLEQIRSWVTQTARLPRHSLVGFLS